MRRRTGRSVDPDREEAQRFGYGSVATRFATLQHQAVCANDELIVSVQVGAGVGAHVAFFVYPACPGGRGYLAF